jgi:hypothetical protein
LAIKPALPRALQLVPTMRWSPGDGPQPPAELEPSPPSASLVVLAGRATRVPEGAVTSGNDRFEGIAAHDTFQPWTSAAGAGWRRLRIPPDRLPHGGGGLVSEAGVALDGASPITRAAATGADVELV